jgi:hypothetical protein
MSDLTMENNVNNQAAPSERGGFQVRIDEQTYTMPSPEPTGRELLAKVGRNPAEFFLVFAVAGQPDQVVELDEPFDLRPQGTEFFILVSRERRFPIQVDEQNFTVKGPFITGAKLLGLVGKDSETHFVTQVLVDTDDIVIGPDQRVDLTQPGRERFTVVVKPCEVIVNTRRRMVTERVLTFEQVVRLAFDTSADNEAVAYTVVYRNGDPSKPNGSMVKGDSVNVRCGMIFDVDRTDRS